MLPDLDLAELGRQIRQRRISAREATEAALAGLDTKGRFINCTVRLNAEQALAAAGRADEEIGAGRIRGPLHGVPMAHKDLFEIDGCLVEAGSKILKGHRSVRTATAIERLDAAGAIYLGSLHMSELALSPTGYNGHLGYCRNPWNGAHITGGSSSGSAAAVAARLVPGALGSDTGGSIRIPAAACGVTGLKPTYGLVPMDGVVPLSRSLDCVGPIARTALDCALLLDVITGASPLDQASALAPHINYHDAASTAQRPLRLGLLPDRHLASLSLEVRTVMERVVAEFVALGFTLVQAEVEDFAPINALNSVLLVVEAATQHRLALARNPNDFSAHVRDRLETGLLLPGTRYVEALALRGSVARQFVGTAFEAVDLLLMPCLPFPVPPVSSETDGTSGTMTEEIVRFTRAMNYLGLPAISIPAGFTSNGLPVGIQLVGRHFGEALLLAAAHRYQQATAWHRTAPPLNDLAS